MTGVFRKREGDEGIETQSHVTMKLEPSESAVRTLRLAKHENLGERHGIGSPWASRRCQLS